VRGSVVEYLELGDCLGVVRYMHIHVIYAVLWVWCAALGILDRASVLKWELCEAGVLPQYLHK